MQRLRSWRQCPSVSQAFLFGSITFGIVVAIFAISLSSYFRQALRQQQNTTLTSIQRNMESNGKPGKSVRSDFASSLPSKANVHKFVEHLQSSSNANNVVLTSISTSESAASTHTFGRTGIKADLKGNYPQIKSVLDEVLSRNPNLMLRSFSLRHLIQSDEIEAHVDFVLLSRPDADL